MGSRKIALSSHSNQVEGNRRTKGQTAHGSGVEHARAATDAMIKTKPLESTENGGKMRGRSVPIRRTVTASQHAANKNTSAAIDGSIGFRKTADEMCEQTSLTPAGDY